MIKDAVILGVVACAILTVIWQGRTRPEPIPEDLLARPQGPEVLLDTNETREIHLDEEDEAAIEKWLAKINPSVLERVANGKGASTNGYTFNVNSSWMPALSNLPPTSLRMRYNQETDMYEFLGVGLELKAGLGVGYEKDPESEESRGYLQFRKSF